MTLHPFQPNHRTYERLRKQREKEKDRIIARIGIEKSQAPLYEEQIRFLAYAASLGRE